jgi:hypothetical protein
VRVETKKRLIMASTILFLTAALIPAVSAGLRGFSVSVSKYQSGASVRMKTRVRAPYAGSRVTPPTAMKWKLYRKDVYGRYQYYKGGWSSIRYTYRYGTWRGTTNKYFYGLNIGSYKYEVTFYESCYYTKEVRTRTFSVTTG